MDLIRILAATPSPTSRPASDLLTDPLAAEALAVVVIATVFFCIWLAGRGRRS